MSSRATTEPFLSIDVCFDGLIWFHVEQDWKLFSHNVAGNVARIQNGYLKLPLVTFVTQSYPELPRSWITLSYP